MLTKFLNVFRYLEENSSVGSCTSFFLLVAVSIRRDKLPKLLLMKIQCLALLVSKMSWQVPTYLTYNFYYLSITCQGFLLLLLNTATSGLYMTSPYRDFRCGIPTLGTNNAVCIRAQRPDRN